MKTKILLTKCLVIGSIFLLNTNTKAASCTNISAVVGGDVIIITSVTGSPFCVSDTAGAQTIVSYRASLNGATSFGTGNVLTVQIALGGNWANAITIATVSTTALTGTITATIPAGTPAGTTYKMRIFGSNPSQAIGGYVPNLTVTNSCNASTINNSVTNPKPSVVLKSEIAGMFKVYPNPSNSNITITYTTINDNASALISIYNNSGKKITELTESNFSSGEHSRTLNLQDYNLNNGIYTITLVSEGKIQTTKIQVP
ncbi:MAG TPA: T9SS type A sorting domain-containing protein [Bacteroidia bacterium]|jgi:hypothetical protein|nr:T9SS type A sorting domain-containing protein [Bacteroidia bacterium]